RENLYQIDLLHGSANRVTEREYWVQKKGQAELDERNAEITAAGLTPRTTKFETDKEKLRQTLRAALDTSTTFEQFSTLLLRQGITVKESRGRLSYLTPDRTKAITARKLGDDFDRAAVLARLEQNAHRVVEERAAALKADKNAPKRSVIERLNEKQTAVKNDGIQRTVDIAAKRAEGKGFGYERWAKVHNLKQMAKAYAIYEQYGFASQEELDSAVATAQANMQKSYAALKAIDPKIAEQKTLQDWILKYIKTKEVCKGINAIKKEKDRTAYKQKHEADFIIYESARRYFDSQGIKKLPTNAAIRAEIQRLIVEKNAAYNAYCADKERFKELQTIQQNLAYMRGEPQPERNKKHEQSL
ncbi:MAG: hypothetical protein IJB94_00680, partial [Clostridia bacterium]|nr:hypothetical protein [Clostridia bacterium]